MLEPIVTELWKLCADGYYSASNLGRIRREKPGARTKPGRLLKLWIGSQSKNAYWFARIYNGSRARGRPGYAHSLIAEAFIGPRPIGMVINHKNGDKLDNRAENLEYVTRSENDKHAFRLNLRKPTRIAKLTEQQVIAIRKKRASGTPLAVLASRYKVCASTICTIAKGNSWRHVL